MPGAHEDNREVDKLFDIVKARYGARLTDEQLEQVKQGVESTAELTAALRGIRLDNAVEPFSTFKPYRGADRHA